MKKYAARGALPVTELHRRKTCEGPWRLSKSAVYFALGAARPIFQEYAA
jgi:hypothetical protein